jgi:hypothetical protein
MVLDAEVRVVHPQLPALQRPRLEQDPAELWDSVQPCGDMRSDHLDSQSTVRLQERRPIENRKRALVHRRVGSFGREVGEVGQGQALEKLQGNTKLSGVSVAK